MIEFLPGSRDGVKSAARTFGIGDAVSFEWKNAFFSAFCFNKAKCFPTFFFLEITIAFINSIQIKNVLF